MLEYSGFAHDILWLISERGAYAFLGQKIVYFDRLSTSFFRVKPNARKRVLSAERLKKTPQAR